MINKDKNCDTEVNWSNDSSSINANSIWVTDFSSSSVADFYTKFDKLEQDNQVAIIPVYIYSYGGEVSALFAMRDLIKSSTKQVATIAVGPAMSSAAILLASGTPGLRFAAPHASILIHEVSAGTYGRTAQIAVDAKDIMATNEALLQALAEDCNKTVSFLKKLMSDVDHADVIIAPEKAQAIGMIDHIEIPRLRVSEPHVGLAVSNMANVSIQKRIRKSSKSKK
jgi:ATP-dependent Clp protease protease subunit